MKYLITGNTGFKGSWLTLLLSELGHDVIGLSLPPEPKSLYNQAELVKNISKQFYVDVTKSSQVNDVIKEVNPDIIVHLAAQPLVMQSYLNPRETIEVNVIGTFNILESLKLASNLISTIIITSDKVYKNLEQVKGYTENDALGGHDLYSASKAMADLLTQSWVNSFSNTPIQIVRAGNVIGGGDYGKDRLIPDIIRSIDNLKPVKIRNPKSIRPWQHVLDCLHGYLTINNFSLSSKVSEKWNVGPDVNSFKSVDDVLKIMSDFIEFDVEYDSVPQQKSFIETQILTLDSNNINKKLNWKNRLDFESAVEITAKWYTDYFARKNLRDSSINQIKNFLNLPHRNKNQNI